MVCTIQITPAGQMMYEIRINWHQSVGTTYITVFDGNLLTRSLLLGGNLFEEGEPERSMVELSKDGVTWTKVCGHKRMLKLLDQGQAGTFTTVMMRLNVPNGVSVKNEVLNVVLVPALDIEDEGVYPS